jgi:predicted secreted protein
MIRLKITANQTLKRLKMKSGISLPTVVFLALIIATSAAIGVVSIVMTPSHLTGKETTKSGSAVVKSASGLNLSLTLGPTAISAGQAVSVGIDEWNTLSTENTVPSASNWPLHGLALGPCGTLNLPIGIEIARGFYTSSNVSGAQALQLSNPGLYDCPMILSSISSYAFEPNSFVAGVVGSCDSNPCFKENVSSTTNVTGYWTGGNNSSLLPSSTFNSFAPGEYTVVGGDEWGALAILHFTVVEGNSTASVILPANTSFSVSSSFDCVAGHYSLNFSVPEQSLLTGGFNAGAPGVTAYVATAQQAASIFQGHPADWVYSTGLVNSSHFVVALPPGSYTVWIEGADRNCGSSIVMPLEMLTQVNVTEAFTLTNQVTGGLVVRLGLNSSSIASGATIGINVSDYNPSPAGLNLSRESTWALDGLSTGGCPSLYYPFGIAVFQGRYTGANASQAVPLRIFPVLPCPLLVRYITGYLFQPMSDNATVLPGTGGVPMATEVSVSGTYYTGGSRANGPTPFSPGIYTVVAGDEWGNLAFAYFVVTPSSNGVAKYTYPISNVTNSISATVGETFIVQLSSNAGSTGYDWNVSTSSGIQYLNYTIVSTSPLIGGPQIRNYFFRAVQAGAQTMTLRDERPFPPYAIAATIDLQVTVS